MPSFIRKKESDLEHYRNVLLPNGLQVVIVFDPDVDPFVLEDGGLDVVGESYELVDGGLNDTLETEEHIHESNIV